MKSRSLFWALVFGAVILMTPSLMVAQLTGDYLIGAGQTYTSLSSAITALNTDGASGQVRFLINQDLVETGSPKISQIALDGVNASLVIKPAPTKTPKVTFKNCIPYSTTIPNGGSGLTIDGGTTAVGFVTIDGSNTANGTTRDMTFILSDTTNGRYCVKVAENADNITIKNLNVSVDSLQLDNTGVGYTYETAGIAAIGSSTLTGKVADNLTVTNCSITGTPTNRYQYKNGIYILNASGGATYSGPVTISNNTVTAGTVGIDLVRGSKTGTRSVISGNSVSLTSAHSGGYTHAAILLENWQDTVNIFNNKLITLKGNNTYASALTLNGISMNIGQAGSVVNCYNNFVSDFQLSGTTTTNNMYGINVTHSSSGGNAAVHNIYYNTVYLSGNNGHTGRYGALRISNNTSATNGTTVVNLKNNILVNAIPRTLSYAIDCLKPASLVTSNYNDLVADTIGTYTAVRATLADWKTATSMDANSRSVNPASPFGGAGQLKSILDLHWFSGPVSSFVGSPIAGFTKDIDGETRSTTNPYMGADEGPTPLAVGPEQGSGPREFVLAQNFPNPFNPATVISYQLSAGSQTKLSVYDLLGREVAVLVNEVKPAGTYSAVWNAARFPSGVYYYQLTTGTMTETRPMVLAK